MDVNVSTMGSLSFQSNEDSSIEIKRKRRIQYRKTKGRFTQKATGVLNRSIYKQNQLSRSINCEDSSEQLVAVRDVNSFLEKNRELAKALEESRSHLKQLHNEKFAFQIECNEMREKLSILQNATLSCSCKKEELEKNSDLNLSFFTDLEKSLSCVLNSLNDHVTKLAMSRCTKDLLDGKSLQTSIESNSTEVTQGSLTDIIQSADKYIEKSYPDRQNKKTQTLPVRLTSDRPVQLRNRKVQVNIQSKSLPCSHNDVISTKSLDDKCVQTAEISTVTKNEQSIQCELLKPHVTKSIKLTQRVPLTPLQQNSLSTDRKSCKKDVKSILKMKSVTTSQNMGVSKQKFQIFVDDENLNKENFDNIPVNQLIEKKVRIQSPAQVRLIHYDGDKEKYGDNNSTNDYSLRNRNKSISYKEAPLNRKLMNYSEDSDSSRQRKRGSRKKTNRRRKQKLNRSINLQELITSVLEESFMTILKKDEVSPR